MNQSVLFFDKIKDLLHRYKRFLPFALGAILILIILLIVIISSAKPEPVPEINAAAVDRAAVLSNPNKVILIEKYAENNACYKENKKLEVKGIMLHSVGSSQPSAKVFARNYNVEYPYNSSICPHAFLQSDGTVYQILPWETAGWHAGGSANATHIGIEMCEPDTIKYTAANQFDIVDEAAAREYVQGTYRTAVNLFAQLCIQYNLDPLEEGVIISHTEGYYQGTASDHGDPEYVWRNLGLNFTMDGFRNDIAARMTELQ